MLDVKTSVQDTSQALVAEADRVAARNLQKTSYAISQGAKARIKRKGKGRKSSPGQPPLTKSLPGKNLRAAIRYHVDKRALEAVIGPDASIVGDVGGSLEFGEDRPSTSGNERNDPRPFMAPSFADNHDKFYGSFEGSLGPVSGGYEGTL